MTADVTAALDEAFRAEWGKVIATLIGMTGDWDLAEECVQDAFTQALRSWPRDGVPRRPGAWLTTVARNRALDRLRRHASEAAKLQQAVILSPPDDPAGGAVDTHITDDRLRLIFTCCHPALPLEARVALTLRTLAGLTTAEIARAFLTAEPTMAKRLVRAKQKIRNAAIPYRVPPAHLLPERTSGVLAVLYLLFNEGYAATAGSRLVRHDLCAEAIRLARVLAGLMPDEPEARALLAAAVRREQRGPYLLQAAIAQCHATAATAEDTDWGLIADLYGVLAQMVPSPVVELNRAVAVGMADGPEAGLKLADALAASGKLTGYYLLPATRADLLRRLGRSAEAAVSYREALDLAVKDAERRYLARRLAEAEGTAPQQSRA